MEMNTPAPQVAVDALSACCRSYLEQLDALEENLGLGDRLASLIGGGARQKRGDLLEAFYRAVQARVEELVQALEGCDLAQAANCAAQAVELLLFFQPEGKEDLDLTLAALDWHAAPLIPLLERDALAPIAERYKKRTPPRLMFPNQKKLYQAMQARLKEV